MKKSVVGYFTFFIFFMFSACSSMPAKQNDGSVTLHPGGSHEECMDLSPEIPLNYSFKASKPVDFNIHYHDESKVGYPVDKKNIAEDQGVFNSPNNRFYCMMWINHHAESVKLTYSFSTGKK